MSASSGENDSGVRIPLTSVQSKMIPVLRGESAELVFLAPVGDDASREVLDDVLATDHMVASALKVDADLIELDLVGGGYVLSDHLSRRTAVDKDSDAGDGPGEMIGGTGQGQRGKGRGTSDAHGTPANRVVFDPVSKFRQRDLVSLDVDLGAQVSEELIAIARKQSPMTLPQERGPIRRPSMLLLS